MKFLRTLTTDITWLYYQGTNAELDQAQRWIDRYRTQWVMTGHHSIPLDEYGLPESSAQRSLAKIRADRAGLPDPNQWIVGWGFKCASDALRFKLSMR